MKGKVFLDTNIFVYSIDSSPGQKKKSQIATDLVREHVRNDSGVISIRVLQEFYHVSTGKIQVPIASEDALEYLNYISILETVHPDFDLVVTAIRLHQKHRLSFWDALILQAARAAGCLQVLSEDLQDGFRIGDMRVKDLFSGA